MGNSFGILGSYSNGIKGNQNVSTNTIGFAQMQQKFIEMNKTLQRIGEILIDPSVKQKEPLCTEKAAIDKKLDDELQNIIGRC